METGGGDTKLSDFCNAEKFNLTCLRGDAGGTFFVSVEDAERFFVMLSRSNWQQPRFYLSDNFAHTLEPSAVSIGALDLDVKINFKQGHNSVLPSDVDALVRYTLESVRAFTPEFEAFVFSRAATEEKKKKGDEVEIFHKFGVHIYLVDIFLDREAHKELMARHTFFVKKTDLPEFESFTIINKKLGEVFDYKIPALRNIASAKPRSSNPKTYSPFGKYVVGANQILRDQGASNYLVDVWNGREDEVARVSLLEQTALFLPREEPVTELRHDAAAFIESVGGTMDEFKKHVEEVKTNDKDKKENEKFTIVKPGCDHYLALEALAKQIYILDEIDEELFVFKRFGSEKSPKKFQIISQRGGYCIHKTGKMQVEYLQPELKICPTVLNHPLDHLKRISKTKLLRHNSNRTKLSVYPNRVEFKCMDEGCINDVKHLFFESKILSTFLFGRTFQRVPDTTSKHVFGAINDRIKVAATEIIEQYKVESEAYGPELVKSIMECKFDYDKE